MRLILEVLRDVFPCYDPTMCSGIVFNRACRPGNHCWQPFIYGYPIFKCGEVTWHWWWRISKCEKIALLALCAGNSPIIGELCGEFPSQRPVTRNFDVFFDVTLRLNKRLNKQSWCRWFETPLRSLWHHCNMEVAPVIVITTWPIRSNGHGIVPAIVSLYEYMWCRLHA